MTVAPLLSPATAYPFCKKNKQTIQYMYNVEFYVLSLRTYTLDDAVLKRSNKSTEHI